MKKTFALCGFMAAGKSTLIKNIAQRFKSNPCVLVSDLDQLIEQGVGATIPSIFNTQGEARFRELEEQCLARWLSELRSNKGQECSVIALGGGALQSKIVQELLVQNEVPLIWIDTPWEICLARILESRTKRPKAKLSIEQLKQLYNKRKILYQKSAITLDGNLTEKEILEQFLCLLSEHWPN